MKSWVGTVVVVALACDQPKSTATTVSTENCPACPSSSTTAATSTPTMTTLDAEDGCAIDARAFVAHVVIPTKNITTGKDDESALWHFECDLQERTCQGIKLETNRLNPSGQLKSSAVRILQRVTLVSNVGSVVTLQWGPATTFTFDTAAQRASYRESRPRGEWRGDVACANRPKGL
jgi:hypothetical protein